MYSSKVLNINTKKYKNYVKLFILFVQYIVSFKKHLGLKRNKLGNEKIYKLIYLNIN